MKRIKTLETKDLNKSAVNGGCGECQTSCQSACKTSCGVANQQCENKDGLAAEARELAGGFTLSGRIVYHSSKVYAKRVMLS